MNSTGFARKFTFTVRIYPPMAKKKTQIDTSASEEEIQAAPPEVSNEESVTKPNTNILKSLLNGSWDEAETTLKEELPKALQELWDRYDLPDYNPLLFLDQSNQVNEDHADQIYSSLCSFDDPHNILLTLGSRGGRRGCPQGR